MAQLSATPPQLNISLDELRKWGFIWRVGTKVRRTKTQDEDDEADESDEIAEAAVDAAVDQAVAAGPQPAGPDALDVLAGAAGKDADPLEVGKSALKILTAEQAGVPADVLALFKPDRKFPSAFDKKQGMDFGLVFDRAVGQALSEMLGGIDVVIPRGGSLLPKKPDCVEVGPARVIGGVRPQNFDVAYRPDGLRIAYDSKTLNDAASVQKNWQNMVNDIVTETTTVHTRFPYAVAAFIIAIPRPALRLTQEADMVRTLERLGTRRSVIEPAHLAEAISLIVWDPATGALDPNVPAIGSNLRWETFMSKVFETYVNRYKGLPPHDK